MIKIVLVLLLIAIILLFAWKIQNKVKIKYKTFLYKGFAPKRGNFGVYCYDGKQGKGKTYSVVEYLLDNKDNICVFCNVKDIKNIDYFFFTGFKELLMLKVIIDSVWSNVDELKKICIKLGFDKKRSTQLAYLLIDYKNNNKQLVFVFDEIFSELQKGSKLDKEVIDFLCQMRKRQIIFLTTAQEWAEIPLTFRRFIRYEIKCNMINIFGFGLLFKEFNDAENMKWSDDQQEHIAPLIETTLTKCRKYISESYNTFLRISSVSPQAITEEKASDDIVVVKQNVK